MITAAVAVTATAGWIACARELRGRTAALERDGLTGLWRREGFERRAPAALAAGNTIALLDLDGFKHINDTAGHAAGDEVLRVVAARLTAQLGESALIARLGGDEFALITMLDVVAIDERLQQLTAALSAPVTLPDGELAVGVSVGVAWLRDLPAVTTGPAPRPAAHPARVARTAGLWPAVLTEGLSAADAALYAAKTGGHGWRLFDRDVDPVRPSTRGSAHGRAAEPDTWCRRVRRSVTARSTRRARRKR